MDRMAVSGTVDAGSIPAWSANVKSLSQRTNSALRATSWERLFSWRSGRRTEFAFGKLTS